MTPLLEAMNARATESQREERESWIVDVALNVDLFRQDYCGYWLRGYDMSADPECGRLVYDAAVEDRYPTPEEKEHAYNAFEVPRAAMPPNWYRLDRAMAEKALLEGLMKYGEDFAGDCDGESTDVAIQLALFGEIRYG